MADINDELIFVLKFNRAKTKVLMLHRLPTKRKFLNIAISFIRCVWPIRKFHDLYKVVGAERVEKLC